MITRSIYRLMLIAFFLALVAAYTQASDTETLEELTFITDIKISTNFFSHII